MLIQSANVKRLACLAALVAVPLVAATYGTRDAQAASPVPVPVSDKPVAIKPATAKPAIAKTATTTPAVAKPVTAKPVTAKPAVAKTAVAKPAAVNAAVAKPDLVKSDLAKSDLAKSDLAKFGFGRSGMAKPDLAKAEVAQADIARPDAVKTAPVRMAATTATTAGTTSGLPVPRYVSLKSDRVNLREGPSKDHRVSWVFQRAGLPVEVTAEFETWRRIRDSEGAEGWVLHSLLSGRRTALVAPWEKGQTFDIRNQIDAKSAVTARLQAGVIASVRSCNGTWCSVTVRDVSGYMKQDRLWGVYPHEQVE